MSRYRQALPQLGGDLFLADAGIETDLIFNHGAELDESTTLDADDPVEMGQQYAAIRAKLP